MTHPVKRRGRPRKNPQSHEDTRQLLVRAGLELLTEQGYVSTGLEQILKKAGVPKGSFYYYFDSKEAFAKAVLESYDDYFQHRLKTSFYQAGMSPMARLTDFVERSIQGMEKHQFRRGCLVGNLAQEVLVLPEGFGQQLDDIFTRWEQLVADCLEAACQDRELSDGLDCQALARFFWIGWEGAVMRARLVGSSEPMQAFYRGFRQLIQV